MTQRSRLRLAAVALHAGVAYRAGGLLLEPERRTAYALPSIAIAGTGKRVGKTAVAGQLARVARGRVAPGEVVIVAMGRGGPAAPELVEPGAVDLLALLGRSRAGQHAASDFLEDALLAGVTAIGCRRCGGGPGRRRRALDGGRGRGAGRRPAAGADDLRGLGREPAARRGAAHAARHLVGRRSRGGARLPRPLPAAAGRRRAGRRRSPGRGARGRHPRPAARHPGRAVRPGAAALRAGRRAPRGGVHDGPRRHARRAAPGVERAARRRGGAGVGRAGRSPGAAGARSRRSTPTCS